jgi:hypothetical protein
MTNLNRLLPFQECLRERNRKFEMDGYWIFDGVAKLQNSESSRQNIKSGINFHVKILNFFEKNFKSWTFLR